MSDDLSDLEGLDLPFDIHKVRPMCHACIRKQVEKYKNHVDEKKRPLENRFIVPCQGALINPVDLRLRNTFSASEWEEIQAIFDPVLWAKKYITHSSEKPWIARFYQEEVMRCTSSRKALRIARRTGKCISIRCNILTELGRIQPDKLAKLKRKPKIVTFDQDSQEFKFTRDYHIWSNGIKPVYKLSTTCGRVTYVTDNHPFLILNDDGLFAWQELKNLNIGDAIAVPSSYSELDFKRTKVGIIWDKINSIELIGEEETFDLTVSETHTLVADDIISHNTDLVSVEICYHMFTKKNQRILVAAPQKVHVEEIINRIRGFISRNANLHNEVVRDVSSPYYEVQLGNGSRVRGFPLGTRGKSEGVAVRGQNADKIYLDEMDFADDRAIVGGLFPILQTTPETTMTGFSTPTGFKSTYYSICEENPYYKEFHYTYKVLPHWRTVEKDRPQYTEDEWTHEILAMWGSAESGVYKPSYIDRSLRSYLYEEQTPQTGWRYVIGVDWNEKHGAELIVVGENVNGGYYQLVEALAVGKSEFTQLKSIEALIVLHRKWFPVKIYVDAGNGCLHKDSLIYTNKGVKEIKDISVGDNVLSHNGIFREVTDVISVGKKNSYLLKPTLCLPVKVSERHNHLVYRSINKFNDFDCVQSTEKLCNLDIDIKEFTTAELDKDKDFLIVPKQDVSNSVNSCVVDLVKELEGVPNLEYDDNHIWNKHSYSTTPVLSAKDIIKKYNTSKATVQRTRRKLRTGEKLAPAERRLAKKLFFDYGEDWYILDNKKISRYIDILDPEFLNLYGWYLSEGHAGINNIEICQMPFHYKDEFDHLISYCSKKWDISVTTRLNGMVHLYILSSLLTEFFKRIGGSHCYNKFIDQRILDNNGYNLLPSLFWGDGHEHQYGVNLSMTSITLVTQVRQMLINNGLLAGLHYVRPRKRIDKYNSAPQLMLYLNAVKKNVDKINKILKTNVSTWNGIIRRKYIELDDCFLVPIRKLEPIGEIDNMYDLTVEEDSSFCVSGFATHNSTNHEVIRKMSYDQRRPGGDDQIAKLLDIVKKYDAGSSIEINDPVTNEKRKTPAKPYMVNSAVRVFEQDKMRISSADKILESQLRNYMIERITPTGTPVYGMRDKKIKDHRLDAFNLAMVAFFKEFGGLQQGHVITMALSAVNPMTKRGGVSRKDSTSGKPEERRLDSSADRSVIMRGAYLPARADIGRNIPTSKPGWEYDLEEHYERLNQHRRNRRNRATIGRGNPIRRTNI